MVLAPSLVVADRFRLVSPLGQGGMGSVWLAEHLFLGIRCAVKFISDEHSQSPGMLARFEREARAIAQIQSPHVVQIFDRGVWMGMPFIAMEYLVGEDLEKRIARLGSLSPRETFLVMSDVCRALAKAHAAGIVHRDLKPANIFLVMGDEREIAKVLDFGIAKDTTLVLDDGTKTGAILGTPFYMSPEQARAERAVDHRSDLWALAVIAFECLTGQRPFTGHALGALFMKILVDPIPVPSHVARLPPGFDGFWARGVAREPTERFQSTKELVEALAIALEIQPSGSFDGFSRFSGPSSQSGSVAGPTIPLAHSGVTGVTPVTTPGSGAAFAGSPESLGGTGGPLPPSSSTPSRRFPALLVGALLGFASLVVIIALLQPRRGSDAPKAPSVAAAPEPPRAAGTSESTKASAEPTKPNSAAEDAGAPVDAAPSAVVATATVPSIRPTIPAKLLPKSGGPTPPPAKSASVAGPKPGPKSRSFRGGEDIF